MNVTLMCKSIFSVNNNKTETLRCLLSFTVWFICFDLYLILHLIQSLMSHLCTPFLWHLHLVTFICKLLHFVVFLMLFSFRVFFFNLSHYFFYVSWPFCLRMFLTRSILFRNFHLKLFLSCYILFFEHLLCHYHYY